MKNSFFIIITALILFSSCKTKKETVSDASCESCDSLKVRIKYKVLERVNCGLLKNAHPSIFIEEIYKKYY